MTDEERQNEQDEPAAPEGAPEADLVLDLNFVPSWARKPPDAARFGTATGEDSRGGRRGRDYGGRDNRGGGGDRSRRDRPQQRDRGAGQPDRRTDTRPAQSYGQPREQRYDARDRFERPERAEELGLSIRFIPCQKQLAGVIRKVRVSRQAFPLMDTAALFLGDLLFCQVVIETMRTSEGGTGSEIVQCKQCKALALDRQVMISHIVSDHLSDYFDREDIETEPPAGQFNCISKCGYSGILLGPPNHHSYNERVNEIHRSRFADMSIDVYRRNIQIVKDPELIEKWKQECRKKTIYKPKNAAPDGTNEPVTLAQAESYMSSTVAPGMVIQTKRTVCQMSIASKTRDQRLLGALRTAWDRECRHPYSLVLALRGACRGGHLHVFKASRGMDFVTAIRPVPLDPERAVESIREVLKYLQEHPGCTRKDLVEALRPGAPVDSPEVTSILSPLRWLVDRGHIIEFFTGALAVPMGQR